MSGRTTKVGLAPSLAMTVALAAACTATREGPPGTRAPTSPRPPVVTASAAPTSSGPTAGAAPCSVFYRAVDAPVRAPLRAPDMPLAESQITRTTALDAVWKGGPAVLRDRVQKNGFAVLAGDGKRTRLGEYYAALRDASVPYVITMDAMVALAHIALDRMFADAEERTVAPALWALLARLDTRLDAEKKKATTDFAAAYTIARGLVAVARVLAETGYVPPADIAPAVQEDVRRALVHAGPAVSAVLGVPIDFATLAPRGALHADDATVPRYRALAWLAEAPLLLAARAEVPGAPLDVSQARDRMRAALLIARLVQPDVDTEAASAWDRVANVSSLAAGLPDDPSPRAVASAARAAGLDVRDAAAFQSVARIDKTRRALVEAAPPRVYDGAGGLVVRADAGFRFMRASTGARVFGPAATPDAVALQAQAFPVSTRGMPSANDVAAWLGSGAARGAPEETRHASVFASGLDAMGVYLGGSRADGALPASASFAWRQHKTEVALGAWTTLRHDALMFARLPTRDAPRPAIAARNSAPEFVEPHPEAIAALLAAVEQASRGLVALGALAEPPPPTSIAGAAIAALRACLAVALREANDRIPDADDASPGTNIPSILVDLEARLAPSRGAARPLMVDVHVDAGSGRVLEEGIGAIDDLYVVVREAGSGRLVLAVGAALAHHELVQPASIRLTDDDWRARLLVAPPPRATTTRAYVVGGAPE